MTYADDSGVGSGDGLTSDQEIAAKMRDKTALVTDESNALVPLGPTAHTLSAPAPVKGKDSDEKKTALAEPSALDENEFVLVDRVHTLAQSQHRDQSVSVVAEKERTENGEICAKDQVHEEKEQEIEDDEDDEDDDDEYVVTWTRGQLGLIFKAGACGETLIRRINKKVSSADGLCFVRVGDVLVAVNGASVRGRAFEEIVQQLRLPEFPVTLSFRTPDLSDDEDEEAGRAIRVSDQRETQCKQLSVVAILLGSSTNAPTSMSNESVDAYLVTGTGANANANANDLGVLPAIHPSQLAANESTTPLPSDGVTPDPLPISESLEDPLGSDEYDVVWREGSLGCGIKKRKGWPTIHSITPGVAVDLSVHKIQLNDVMIRINGMDTKTIGFPAVIETMRSTPKPIYMRFRRAVHEASSPPPPPHSLPRDLAVAPSSRELRERETAAQGHYRASFAGFTEEERGLVGFADDRRRREEMALRPPASYEIMGGRSYQEEDQHRHENSPVSSVYTEYEDPREHTELENLRESNMWLEHTSLTIGLPLSDLLDIDETDSFLAVDAPSGTWNEPPFLANRIASDQLVLVCPISAGQFGDLWLGQVGDIHVAIKQLKTKHQTQAKAVMFATEIVRMTQLSHPKIAAFVGVEWTKQWETRAVAEFLPRGDLRSFMSSPEAAILDWTNFKCEAAMDIVDALLYLHSQPCALMATLTSRNVLLDGDDGLCKLSLFAVARSRHRHLDSAPYLPWVAPEIVLGENSPAAVSAIYSFGVLLCELDTARLPFFDAFNPDGTPMSSYKIAQLVALGKLEPSLSEECPEGIASLARDCLSFDPLSRPTAARIAYRLREVLKNDL